MFHGGSSRLNDRTRPSELLVVSWNIQFGVKVAEAAEALLAAPELQDADIILLQEMDEHGTELIADTVGLEYVYEPSSVHPQTGRNFGNAVLARWPLTGFGVVQLPFTSALQGQPRQVVHAVANVGGIRIRACSVHTEVPTLSPPKRRQQFTAIGDVSHAWEQRPLVIGGDFNTLTSRGVDTVSTRLAPIGVRRVTKGAGPTLRRGGREFVLDHIYARSLAPRSCGVVTGLGASDHRPLWVRLTIDGHVGSVVDDAVPHD